MNKIWIKGSLTALTILATIPAYAEEPEFEDGIYISGLIGARWADPDWIGTNTVSGYDELDNFVATETSLLHNTGDDDTQLVGSIAVGYQFVNDLFYLGLEVAGTFGDDLEFEASDSNTYFFDENDDLTINSSNHAKASLRGSELDLDFKPGILLDENFLIYVRVGAAFNELEIQSSSAWSLHDELGFDHPSASDHSSESNNVTGLRLGAGLEYLITEEIGVSIDYVYTDYGDIKTSTSGFDKMTSTDGYESSISGNAKSKIEVVTNTLMAGVTYHF